MEEKTKVVVRHFRITTTDAYGKEVSIDIPNSHYAEMILRGVVHSGMSVTITEITDIQELTKTEITDLNLKGYTVHPYRDCIPYFLNDSALASPAVLSAVAPVPQFAGGCAAPTPLGEGM